MFSAIFIDADNTLFNFDRTESAALSATLRQFSLPDNDAALAQYRTINKACWQRFDAGEIRNEAINELRWRQWLQAVSAPASISAPDVAGVYADQLARQCELEDGADALIRRLTAKLPVHVITNGFPSSQVHRWRLAGWEDKLHGLTVSAVVGVQKPQAEIFHLAMAAVGVTDPSRCLMIGDSLDADVRGPQAVGMKACWYQRPGARNATDIQPDYVVQHLDQIAEII